LHDPAGRRIAVGDCVAPIRRIVAVLAQVRRSTRLAGRTGGRQGCGAAFKGRRTGDLAPAAATNRNGRHHQEPPTVQVKIRIEHELMLAPVPGRDNPLAVPGGKGRAQSAQ
jgi:hypothetical protein